MRSHENDYAGYLIDTTVDKYCQDTVELPDRELEELSLQALTSVLHRPAGFGLQVLMLIDASGSTVDEVSYCTPDSALLGSLPHNDVLLTTCLFFRP